MGAADANGKEVVREAHVLDVAPGVGVAAAQQQAYQAPAPAAPVDPATQQLQNLASLHAQGILSDEEFAAAKAKVLGI